MLHGNHFESDTFPHKEHLLPTKTTPLAYNCGSNLVYIENESLIWALLSKVYKGNVDAVLLVTVYRNWLRGRNYRPTSRESLL